MPVRNDTNPAAPGTNRGPAWASTLHDGLLLPDGRRVGDVPGDQLYREFSRLQIPGFNHGLGRLAALELYDKHLAAVAKAGADAATSRWLQNNRS